MVNFDEFKEKIQSFFSSSMRIFNVSRKPDKREYSTMAKITGLGILIIGFIGFMVKLIVDGFLQLWILVYFLKVFLEDSLELNLIFNV